HEQCLSIYLGLEDRFGASASLNHLGIVQRGRKQYEAAQAYFDESVIIKREINDQRGLASVLINLALLHISQDNWQEVKPLTEEVVTLAEETQADEPLATAHML